jgi:hypothetical protein
MSLPTRSIANLSQEFRSLASAATASRSRKNCRVINNVDHDPIELHWDHGLILCLKMIR